MPEYGITETGVVIKRLDTILSEINADQTAGFGVRVGTNLRSFLNVLNTSVADKIAELWELGADIYQSISPASAEGAALDNAVQFSGIRRETAKSTIYPIHCECTEGVTLDRETLIESDTNPAIKFLSQEQKTITRSEFNKVKVKVVTRQNGEAYTVAINGNLYSHTCLVEDSPEDILRSIMGKITEASGEEFKVSLDAEAGILTIEAVDVESVNSLLLTDNLTTESVTAIIEFASQDPGEFSLPPGAITQIVTAPTGFLSCTNLCGYVAGRLLETDLELRQSYIDKIFNTSTRMVDSIRSAILTCQGVTACKVYENRTNDYDADGRPPHSVEAVVDGGSNEDIARKILDTSAGGIWTHGSTSVELPGEDDDTIEVHFNRPTYIYVWFKVTVHIGRSSQIPPNYSDLITAAIVNAVESLGTGDDVIPQQFLNSIYAQVPGIKYVDIAVYHTTDSGESKPGEYPDMSVDISPRERAVTTETRIEVALNE